MEKRSRRCRGVNKRLFIALTAAALIAGSGIGGTVAWLAAETTPVVNTFTYGDITIDLWEHKYDPADNELTDTEVDGNNNYRFVPGVNLPKDPTVTVNANSEACWLFVEVNETDWPAFTTGEGLDQKLEVRYEVDTGTGKWIAGDGTNIPANVYYREVSEADAKAGKDYPILEKITADDCEIEVSDTLTKIEIESLTEKTPVLEFNAYAVQLKKNETEKFTAAEAWNVVKP